MTDTFQAMMTDIAQDYGAALRDVAVDASGCRQWRDVVYAHVMGYRPLTLYVSVPRARRRTIWQAATRRRLWTHSSTISGSISADRFPSRTTRT